MGALRGGCEKRGESGATAGETCLDGPVRNAEFRRDLGDRQIGEVVQDDGFALSRRRQRLTASRIAVVRTQASGCRSASIRSRCCQARSKASWTTSSASARLPHMA
ncbi:hypothetical protein N803_05020 [Knoellia subterranea KCTC 19937]|uniref:Uncharacterized protein n=1 Tax=Knoellia subterranea KCTC 19937 TaxID=1385521 RepID=A0A0A0JGK6_9MICO|nr:hypothetical protein N803_05020 [Knoellia subterranea KCTC 19937]